MGKHHKNKKKTSKKMVFLSLLRLIFFITAIISIVYISKWYMDSRENKMLEEKVSDTVVVENTENEGIKYKVDFEKLKKTNEDTVAWLKVNGTGIEYPVVKYLDNDFYLTRNFEKKYNQAGWIFADYRNKFDSTDKNTIIYGHNRKDNSMFGTLKKILNEEWYNNEENYIINLTTEKEEQQYYVFSVYQIESENYYIQTNFTDNEFEGFVKELKNRSLKDFGVEVTAEDNILTLYTCGESNKYRVVLHAKRIK